MEANPSVNVVIPTYNRKKYLNDTLSSLAKQTWPNDRFEVIVVDDGSTDGTEEIIRNSFPFALHYVHQQNQGDAIARNTGVKHSQAEILVFLDDDMLVDPNYLAHLIKEQQTHLSRIIVGTEILWYKETEPPIHRSLQGAENDQHLVEQPFPFVFSRNMSIRRDAYIDLGMMDNLGFSGSSIWCDVDFTYRAHLQGFQFLRSTKAICYHRDYATRDLTNAKTRNWEAAYRAVVLFQKYPDLIAYLPMFHDKRPINWSEDSFRLAVRKIIRQVASVKPVLVCLERIVNLLEQYYSSSYLLGPLYRWIIGNYTYRGFREGLREFGPIVGA